MAFKYSPHTLKKIETIFQQLNYIVRYEKGRFNSGFCVLEDKRVVVVNKFFDVEARINTLIEILNQIEIDVSGLDDKNLKFYKELTKSDDTQMALELPSE
ncbi:MAG: hypothetical protein K1X55_09850 [Chitinophagales bacterium]|nr:hypothetical protein [Chitinophagales bacterium]